MARTLLKIAGLLSLGVIINIAVAWGVPPHMTRGNWSNSHDEAPFWSMKQQGGPGDDRAVVSVKFRILGEPASWRK